MPTILIQVLSKRFSKIAQSDKRIRAHTLLHKIINNLQLLYTSPTKAAVNCINWKLMWVVNSMQIYGFIDGYRCTLYVYYWVNQRLDRRWPTEG